MLDSRENVRKEFGMKILKNLTMGTHQACRKARSWIRTEGEKRKGTIKQEYRIKGPTRRRRGVRASQLDCNTTRKKGEVKTRGPARRNLMLNEIRNFRRPGLVSTA